jgi:hypothetical protein
MLILKVHGTVREVETEIGLPGLVVKVYDHELRFGDLIGTTYTGEAGRNVSSSLRQLGSEFKVDRLARIGRA